MRRLLARMIVGFSKFITYPLSPFRRASALAIACEGLYDEASFVTKQARLRFHASSRRGFDGEWSFGTSETDTIKWIDTMSEGSCFWDIGANIGVFSLYAALGKKAQVLAFEPAGGSFFVLNTNIELNRMSERITGYCMAFSDETKLDVLNMESIHPGNSMQGFGTEINQFDQTIPTNSCQGAIGFSIDDFVNIFSPDLPTHVKIDVDGTEADILRGGRRVLSAPSVKSAIVEIEGDLNSVRNQEIMSLMTELGFSARTKESAELRNVIFDKLSQRCQG